VLKVLATNGTRPLADGLHTQATFATLFTPPPLTNTSVAAMIGNVEMQRATVTSPLRRAVMARGLLRTVEAYVDRSRVLVAYQLHDKDFNVRVSTAGLSVVLMVRPESGASLVTSECEHSSLSMDAHHFSGVCLLSELPVDWFGSHATVTANLTFSYDGVAVQSTMLG
jgi:hypothetical protein